MLVSKRSGGFIGDVHGRAVSWIILMMPLPAFLPPASEYYCCSRSKDHDYNENDPAIVIGDPTFDYV
jgi:hypothetical protein